MTDWLQSSSTPFLLSLLSSSWSTHSIRLSPASAQAKRYFVCMCATAMWSTCIHLQQSSPSRWSHCRRRCCCCGSVCAFICVFMCMFSLTGHKAHSPEARVQRHLHLHALVLLQDDALHHDEPVVSGHGHPHQQQPAGSKHSGQDGQSAAAARTHLRGGGEEVGGEEQKGVRQEGGRGRWQRFQN